MEAVNIYSGAFHSDSFLENEKWSLIALIIPFVAASTIFLILISSMFVYGSRVSIRERGSVVASPRDSRPASVDQIVAFSIPAFADDGNGRTARANRPEVPCQIAGADSLAVASSHAAIGTYSRCFTASRSDLSAAAPPYRDSSALKLPNWLVNCGAL